MTYSVEQMAKRYQVSAHTVLTWIANGDLAAVNVARHVGGKPRWRITQEAVQAFDLARAPTPVQLPERRRRKKADPSMVQFY